MTCGICMIMTWHETWEMMMNDIQNDNDMKWHDRMTYDDFSAWLVHAALDAAWQTPHPPMLPGCDRRSSFTAFYPFRLHVHVWNFTKTFSGPFIHTRTYPDPQYLAFKVCFPLFSTVGVSCHMEGPFGVWNSLLEGSLFPTTASLSSFPIHLSCNWSQQGCLSDSFDVARCNLTELCLS